MNKTKIIVFVGIIVVGLIISLFTLNMCGTPVEDVKDPGPGENKGTETPKVGEIPVPDSPKATPEKGEKGKAKTKAEPKAPEATKTDSFDSPEALMSALSEKVKARDFDAFEEIAGANAFNKTDIPKVRSLIENEKLSLNGEKPFVELSKSAESVRWAIQLSPEEKGGTIEEIYTDITKKNEKSFGISKVSLPVNVAAIMKTRGADPTEKSATAPATPNDPAKPDDTPKPAADAESPDAVAIAHAFSKAVVDRDFEIARALSDPSTVTDERIAALLIAMEEGKFNLQKDRPLIVTLSREDITWVLTRIQSGDQASEFAQELGKVGTDWKVNGLTFSKVIAALANRAGGGNVAYTPIVEDPSGGDSLVLYFEFDDSGVTERTRRQLAIVSDILKQSPTRKLRINGHADAKGSDDYNAQLSEKRASSVRDTLISQGVTPTQIITEAFGETRPRNPNFNPDGTDNTSNQSRNRRAEVYLDF